MTISSGLNFGRPAPPGRGSAALRKFLAPRYCGQRAVFASLREIFSFLYVYGLDENYCVSECRLIHVGPRQFCSVRVCVISARWAFSVTRAGARWRLSIASQTTGHRQLPVNYCSRRCYKQRSTAFAAAADAVTSRSVLYGIVAVMPDASVHRIVFYFTVSSWLYSSASVAGDPLTSQHRGTTVIPVDSYITNWLHG